MKRAIIYLLLVVLAVIGTVIARLNAEAVAFDYYFSEMTTPLVLLLYGAFALGAVMAVLLSLAMIMHARREASRLRKRLEVCEQEIKNLREIPIKGKY